VKTRELISDYIQSCSLNPSTTVTFITDRYDKYHEIGLPKLSKKF